MRKLLSRRLARSMAPWLLLLAFIHADAAGWMDVPQTEGLYPRLSAEYQPLHDCVQRGFKASGKSRAAVYAEIAASSPDPGLSNAASVGTLVEKLESWESHTADSGLDDTLRLIRRIGADSILGKAPSIRCGETPLLRDDLQLAQNLETYVFMSTALAPYAQCNNKAMMAAQPPSQLLHRIAVSAEFPALRTLASRAMEPSDPMLVAAQKASTDDLRVQAYVGGLTLATRSNEADPMAERVAKLNVRARLNRLIVTALDAPCTPTPELAHYFKIMDRDAATP